MQFYSTKQNSYFNLTNLNYIMYNDQNKMFQHISKYAILLNSSITCTPSVLLNLYYSCPSHIICIIFIFGNGSPLSFNLIYTF